MNLQISDDEKIYEINMLGLTQLCGENILKKDFIIKSLCKHFSSEKYADYEERYQDNIIIDGEKIGRKYFATYRIRERNDILNCLKLIKNGLLTKYISGVLNEFECQKELEIIAEHLDKLYIKLNNSALRNIPNIELGYEINDIFDIIQSSSVNTYSEKSIMGLENYKLFDTFTGLISQLQEKNPEKVLIIIENIDHMLNYNEYMDFCEKIKELCSKYDIWCVVTMSISGFVYMDYEYITGINVVNDMIYIMPETELLVEFIKNNYPCRLKDTEGIIASIKSIIHEIGKEGYVLDIKGKVILKMINSASCIACGGKKGINSIENSFLIE